MAPPATPADDRDRETIERWGIGTVHEATRDSRFVVSSRAASGTGTVHERPPLTDADGYALDPKCGQTLGRTSVWGGIDADSPEAVAREYGYTEFCSKCFDRPLALERVGREARADV
jgi:hypothetical protein